MESRTEYILDNAYGLAALIKNSREYAEYLQQKAAVDAAPALAKELSAYKRFQSELFDAGSDSGGASFLLERRAADAYYAIANKPELYRFIEAERAIIDLIGEVIDIITSQLPIDLSFLEADNENLL